MGMAAGGTRGIVSDPNVVPFIDILLVLLVIFMLMPHSTGSRRRFRSRAGTKDLRIADETNPA